MNFNNLEEQNVDISLNAHKTEEKYSEKVIPDKKEIEGINIQIKEEEKPKSIEAPKIEEKKETIIEYDTLDESVWKTFQRDLLRIFHKIKHVAIPTLNSKKSEELQNWDLWGPLLICLVLCIALSIGDNHSTDKTFVIVFAIVWVGGLVITFNAQFLGAKVGMCQVICLLGYCTFPIMLAAVIIVITDMTKPWLKVLITAIAFIWSCLSSVGFISSLVKQEKKFVAVYPVFLFFLSLCGFILNY